MDGGLRSRSVRRAKRETGPASLTGSHLPHDETSATTETFFRPISPSPPLPPHPTHRWWLLAGKTRGVQQGLGPRRVFPAAGRFVSRFASLSSGLNVDHGTLLGCGGRSMHGPWVGKNRRSDIRFHVLDCLQYLARGWTLPGSLPAQVVVWLFSLSASHTRSHMLGP